MALRSRRIALAAALFQPAGKVGAVLLAGFLLLLAAPLPAQETQSEEAPEQEQGIEPPDARALLRASAEFLAAQQTFSFSWFVSYDLITEDEEKLTFLRSGSSLMQRDVGFYFEAEEGDRLREYRYDGEVFSVYAPEDRFYAAAFFDGGFRALVEALRNRTGLILPLWSMLAEDAPERLLSGTAKAAYVGFTRVGGIDAHHLAFSAPAEEGKPAEDWQVWVAADDDAPLPLVIIGTDRATVGWPTYRAHFIGWDLAPEVDPEIFAIFPDDDVTLVAMPELVPALDGRHGGDGGDGGDGDNAPAPQTDEPAPAEEAQQ